MKKSLLSKTRLHERVGNRRQRRHIDDAAHLRQNQRLGNVLMGNTNERISVGHLVDQSSYAKYVRFAIVTLKVAHFGRHERHCSDHGRRRMVISDPIHMQPFGHAEIDQFDPCVRDKHYV
jgi:hypothetical protein